MGSDAEENPIGFAATQWSLVRRAGQATAATRRSSLETLLQRYLPALRAHLTFDKKISAESAEDLLQGFIADKIVEQNLIALADQSKGKFRSFLLLALNRYVIDQRRRDGSAKRGGQSGKASDAQSTDHLISPEPQPSEQFEIAWAQELIARALQLMKDECQQTGRKDIWEIFECRVVRPAFGEADAICYEELIAKFGLQTPLQAYNLLTTSKRMFVRCLREAAADYAGEGELADLEIDELKTILARVGA